MLMASLNIYYFVMSVYGWYNWVQKKDGEHLTYPISWCSKKELSIGIFLFFVILGNYLLYFGQDHSLAIRLFLDSLVSVLSAVVACGGWQKEKLRTGLVDSQ